MAVDIKSLRIGSHIDFNGRRVKIKAIVEDSVAFDYTQDEKKLYLSPNDYDEFLSPIPITSELLKELGFQFRKSAGGSWCISDKKGGYFYATVCSNSTCVVTHYPDFGFQSRVVCTYLHELEAFAYLIARTELIPD